MVGQALTLSALVALSQAKAIVTNQCEHDVYIWSVPEAQGMAKGLSVAPGGRYDEPWRTGTSVNPGIAIKVSPHSNGISQGKSEIDYQYTVDSDKVWINLSKVRGGAFGNNTTFYTCHGPYKTPDVPTRQCSITDEVELVLCGGDRTGEAEDTAPTEVINQCASPPVVRDSTNTSRQPRQCHARVVGPKRTPQPKTEAAVNKSNKDVKTVPLKTILRECPWTQNNTHVGHTGDCSPNVARTEAHEERGNHGEENIVCDNVRTALGKDDDWPCDEQQMKLLLKLTYNICVNPVKVHDIDDCKKMQQKNPPFRFVDSDVGNFAVSKKSSIEKSANIEARNDKKTIVCINNLCHQQRHFASCHEIKKAMEKVNHNIDYTTDEDKGCHTDKE